MIHGSCLCGGVRFEITGKVSAIGRCHCSLCRKVSGAAADAKFLTARRSLRWIQGEELVQLYSRPTAWTTAFCQVCGSPLPLAHPNGKLFYVPAGLLDDDPGTRVELHIYVGSKAPWDEIAGSAPQYKEAAPPYSQA